MLIFVMVWSLVGVFCQGFAILHLRSARAPSDVVVTAAVASQ